ncbi:hypothetical protein PS3A_11380 [Pseudomonas sp. 3A(2025)]
MKNKNGALASTDPACPKKATELFFVIHPNVATPLLGPLLTASEAECARSLIGSADAVVESRAVVSTEDFIHGHAVKNGRVCRVLLGLATQGRQA